MKKNNRGFTLAELLIVVAIIAVLVAIAIPVFTSQLEKARESADLANVRSAYGELMSEYLTKDANTATFPMTATVKVTQTQASWQSTSDGKAYIGSEMKVGTEAKKTRIEVPAATSGDYTLSIDKTGECTITAGSGSGTGTGSGT